MQQTLKQNNYLFWFLTITLFITCMRIGILAAHSWPVNGDETQYWSWAKHLAWGYYSKPPMLAWLIALSTHLFGNGIVAIRLASPLTHSVTALMIYFSARYLYRENENQAEKIALWAGLIYLLAPGVSFSSTIISTDPPLLMFWSIAFYCFIRAIQNNVKTRFMSFWWIGVGLFLGFAMLSKYAALFFVISMLFYFIVDKEQRSNFFKPGFYLALIITSLILLPNIIWNNHHAFASIQAVENNADLQAHWFHPGQWLNFLIAQFALINPIIFSFLLIFMLQPKVWFDPKGRLLLVFIIPVFAVMLIESLLVHAHGNWAATMYIAAAILVSAEVIKRHKNYLLILALLLNLIMIGVLIHVQTLVRSLHIKIHQSTTIVNWRDIGKSIVELHQQYPNAKLLVDDRMLLTEIIYFGKFNLIDTFKWNPLHQLRGQYDLVTHLNHEIGDNFLLFTYNQAPFAIMQRFKAVNALKPLQLVSIDGRNLPVYVFYLTGFKGYASVKG